VRLAVAILLGLVAVVGVGGVGGVGAADDQALRAYYGKIVITKTAAPKTAGELPEFLAANASKDGSYELIGGAPWDMNLVAVLAKETSGTVSLEFLDAGKPMHALDVTAKGRLVTVHAQATTAAGFAARKTYSLRIKSGDAVLAKAELTLRD
jgi:hypothetical protein